jgi:hypothetical protein
MQGTQTKKLKMKIRKKDERDTKEEPVLISDDDRKVIKRSPYWGHSSRNSR